MEYLKKNLVYRFKCVYACLYLCDNRWPIHRVKFSVVQIATNSNVDWGEFELVFLWSVTTVILEMNSHIPFSIQQFTYSTECLNHMLITFRVAFYMITEPFIYILGINPMLYRKILQIYTFCLFHEKFAISCK